MDRTARVTSSQPGKYTPWAIKRSQLIFVCNFINKNSSGDEIANVNFFYNIAHIEASAYAH